MRNPRTITPQEAQPCSIPLTSDREISPWATTCGVHYFHKAGGNLNLVLLHPSSGYGRMWELTAGYLDRRFSVYAPDQRGHGDSGRPDGEYSAEELAKELREVVDRLGLKRVVVGGHSLGGRATRFERGSHVSMLSSIDKAVGLAGGGAPLPGG